MSFDREYKRRKDWRRPYLGKSRIGDSTCRPHGSCGYCRSNRLHSRTKSELSSLERLREFGRADQPDREQAPKPRKSLKKRWGVEFYSPWFGQWKIRKWYSTAEERDRDLARLEQSEAEDRNGRPLRFRKSKR
jgi:hypothetical protein